MVEKTRILPKDHWTGGGGGDANFVKGIGGGGITILLKGSGKN